MANPSRVGLLELSINDSIKDLMKTTTRKSDEGVVEWLLLEMRTREYERLAERRRREVHEGHRHIYLSSVSKTDKLDLGDCATYSELKRWELIYSQIG